MATQMRTRVICTSAFLRFSAVFAPRLLLPMSPIDTLKLLGALKRMPSAWQARMASGQLSEEALMLLNFLKSRTVWTVT